MKKDIHPTYYPKARVTCACGNIWTTGSTLPEIKIELCSNCHPFFTGKQKLVDTSRRVEKFQERAAKRTAASASRGGRAKKTAKRQVKKAAKTK
jgi:large subunit ribosomal protein L31